MAVIFGYKLYHHQTENAYKIRSLINSYKWHTQNNITTPTISGNKEYAIYVVHNNATVLDYDDNWNLLLYTEAFLIKCKSPSLNNGLKSSRELYLFSRVYLM